MRHQDLTANHIIESWTYANAAARTAATGFVLGDIGRIAYQQDNGTYWRLTGSLPVVTWAALQNNIIESWTYANAAARTGATGFIPGDIGRLAYQTDTAQYWRLTATTPAWLLIAPNKMETWVYATATDRTTATGFIPNDVGRIAYQTDTAQYWRLSATTPTWSSIAGAPVAAAVYASINLGPSNPTGVVGGTLKMQGLGAVGWTLTPTATGKVLVTLTGWMGNNTIGGSATGTLYRGTTFPAPVNNAALTGTAMTPAIAISAVATANYGYPFTTHILATGLAVGTQYWFDFALAAGATGTAFIAYLNATAIELP
jgi:hypothetical protein